MKLKFMIGLTSSMTCCVQAESRCSPLRARSHRSLFSASDLGLSLVVVIA